MEAAAAQADLAKIVAGVIDTMLLAELTPDDHLLQLLSSGLRRPAPRVSNEELPCWSFDNPAEFAAYVSRVVLLANLHSHPASCIKGASGACGCRLFFPQACDHGTRACELAEGDKGSVLAGLVQPPPPMALYNGRLRDHAIFPLVPRPSTIIVVEPSRRTSEVPDLVAARDAFVKSIADAQSSASPAPASPTPAVWERLLRRYRRSRMRAWPQRPHVQQ